MSSAETDRFDLDVALPTTPRDLEAQRRLRQVATDDVWGGMQRLHDGLPPGARAPRRRTARGWPPFEL